ncbi:metalloregulator ArsR/SmtB family transcription factor [Chitiniphilus purpureus]|uniref:Metalloregulator ArsR/SmtB family transcription factor n=1 Tax=Chitiniphilus purpureus TaxID=2981137 RepID=A0ABY6DJE4_9NEIS|nr:metalloregulator ArsR/SmtB family transcription factor [Chitiniphilus sp. CD1]UXY14162.1 metalloregulator ArsR/SmtB family transcription factor [Chitiniphilus sp. CD1]
MSIRQDGVTTAPAGPEPVNETLTLLQADLESGLFKALSEPTRQRIVSILLQHGRLSIMQIKAFFPQDRSVVSRHLKFLRETGVVNCTQQGRYAYYELNSFEVMGKLQGIVERLGRVLQAHYPAQWEEFEKQADPAIKKDAPESVL